MPGPHQNIQNLGAGGMYGTNTNYGGGGTPVARSELDSLRIGVGRQPQAEYPDGYLGTIRSRRDDKGRRSSTSDRVLDSLKQRTAQRPYQRGVHKGERIDASSYYYPSGLSPERGLERQARAVRNGNVMTVKRNRPMTELVTAPHLVNDGKANITANGVDDFNKIRSKQFDNMKPSWR